MVRSCCAPGCTQRDTALARKNNITFHRVPLKFPIRIEKWLSAVHHKTGMPWVPTKNSSLCSVHFTKDCFDRTGQIVRLRDHAVPSVFPTGLQKKASIKCFYPSQQENVSVSQPTSECNSNHHNATYLQDHLYHLPSKYNVEKYKKNMETTDPPSIIEEECHSSSIFPELLSGELRLYYHKLCPFSHRTRLVLKHKKIRCITVSIDPKSKPSWFLQKSPFSLLPLLEEDDKIIYGSLVCNEYLNEVYPDPLLQQSDPYIRAKDKMLIGQFDKIMKMVICSISENCQEFDFKQKLIFLSQLLEKELEVRGNYFGGLQIGMLDFNLWPWFERLEALEVLVKNLNGFLNDLPTKLFTWKKRMLEEPIIQSTKLDIQQHIEFLKSIQLESET